MKKSISGLISVVILSAMPSLSQAMDNDIRTMQARDGCPEGCIPVYKGSKKTCDCPTPKPKDGGPIIEPSPIKSGDKSLDGSILQQ